ncbi:hypothetical protein SR870_23080 [Rhodopseudomonas palustris]|uniref:hypothetical protein n=1 Tax=Rhodopseudomonas palustris TaxID=1076 RepID=UPI002ACED66C|nr:hypothetical protein [Rhodopseudomonas palustris]WQG99516.1 hypothetical protein SR870_23080 [Rhodopseudomonas palustris]
MAHDARTLDEIRRDTERARAGLTETVGELRATVADTATDLRERYSPQAIKDDVTSYIKTRGEDLADKVSYSIRNNPVQAVAVGATLAYPLWKIVRAIPTPVLMVGAGLYLAGTKSGQQLTQRASDAAVDLAGDVERQARAFGADAADTVEAARDYATGALQAAGEAASSRANEFRRAASTTAAELKHKGEEFGRTVSSQTDELGRTAAAAGGAFAGEVDDVANRGAGIAGAVTDTLRDTAASVRDTATSMRESATDAAVRLRDKVGETADAGLHAAARARDRAADMGQRAGKTFTETVSAHPLLVAGAGLIIGGLIASAIPRLRAEKQMFGGASRRMREQAEETATRAVGAVKQKGREVYESAVNAAEDEGLTRENIGGQVHDLGDRARKVADAAVSTFEAPSQNKH